MQPRGMYQPIVKKGRVCIGHGAKVKRCQHEGCNNHIVKGGVCIIDMVPRNIFILVVSNEGCSNMYRTEDFAGSIVSKYRKPYGL